jgi:Flp pilus assembly protein TadD
MPANTTAPPSPQADACVDTALDRMAAGDAQGAIPHLRSALAIEPQHAAATHALLRALEDTGRLSEALTLAREQIARDPDDVLAHTRLSILLQRTGDVPAAEAAAASARILGWKLQLRNPDTSS